MADDALATLDPARHDNRKVLAGALRAIEREAGGREQLSETLFAGALDTDDDLSYVIGLIGDPRYDARDLAELCAAGGVKLGTLMEAYKRGAYARMQIQVVTTIATRTPSVVADVYDRALAHYVECGRCHGSTTVAGPAPNTEVQCPGCNGSGQQLQQPSLDTQKVALEMGGLVGKRGPLVDNSRTLVVNPGSASGFKQLMADTDKLLYKTGPRAVPTAEWDAPQASLDGEVLDTTRNPVDSRRMWIRRHVLHGFLIVLLISGAGVIVVTVAAQMTLAEWNDRRLTALETQKDSLVTAQSDSSGRVRVLESDMVELKWLSRTATMALVGQFGALIIRAIKRQTREATE